MDKKKIQLIEKAKKIYGEIFPCINRKTLEECFTSTNNGEPLLWFNTKDHSTHIVSADTKITVYDVVKIKKGSVKDKKM